MAFSKLNGVIIPDWDAPAWVGALSTTRVGGCSQDSYAELNLGMHVGDLPTRVAANRQQLAQHIATRHAPVWLEQIHSRHCIQLTQYTDQLHQADASYTKTSQLPCAVMTADCLPILLCSASQKEVAAVHAGWRGLADGVLTNALKQFSSSPSEIMAWLGPAIGPTAFEVGEEVRVRFMMALPDASQAFIAAGERWLCDLPQLAALTLQNLGIKQIYQSGCCTYSEPQHFFSYRRDGVTGRMASLIWIR